ncbi:MAG: hypothetical protein FJ276_31020 [Planctomycetes bacterium]|nr:hypothetical protein [Planctomycetota bacterium]
MSPILTPSSRLDARYGQLLPIGAIVPAVLRRYQLTLPGAALGEPPWEPDDEAAAADRSASPFSVELLPHTH